VKIAELNWMQVEEYLKRDDRALLPLGCTEQHAYLSLCTDSILAERVAAEAAEPLGLPVFPVVGYGITPSFRAYPGTVSLRVETLLAVVRDVLDALRAQGFRRLVIVNGHGGNSPAASLVNEWLADHPGTRIKFHNWWNAPNVWAKVQEIDPVASHASWMENFHGRASRGHAARYAQAPAGLVRHHAGRSLEARQGLGDGNFGGRYVRSDEEMLAIWRVAVEETRALAESW